MKISIVGLGRVGTSLFMLLKERFRVVAVSSKNFSKSDVFSEVEYAGEDNFVCASKGDVVFITTPDDVIPKVDEEIFSSGDIKNKVVFHCSGSNSSLILKHARASSNFVASFHPLQTVPDLKKGVENLKKAYFCIEGDEEAIEVAKKIAEFISGKYFVIDSKFKSVYHCGGVFASNFITTLIYIVCELYREIGISKDYSETVKIISPLMEGAVESIKELGVEKALTGPVVRGDVSTVKKHIQGLKEVYPSCLELYKKLTEKTVELAMRKNPKEGVKNVLGVIYDS